MPPLGAGVVALIAALPALAASGDIYQVSSDLVNLRAGPSNEANVRDRVAGGTEVIELDRDGNWYGVRTLDTGAEGWIYGDLLTRVSTTSLETLGTEAGFGEYSGDFDRLFYQIGDRLGFSLVNKVEVDGDRLTIDPSSAWLRASSQDAHAMASAAIYQMWKNYRNNAPVSVVLLDENDQAYVVSDDDGEAGPMLTVNDIAIGREE
jgi:uncharacterized protein YgiM (DUF1202 family)